MLLQQNRTRTAGPQPSPHAGMGAVPHAGGVSFRIWAPNAEAAFVVGTFNGWHPDANPLAAEGGGIWSADVPGVGPGDLYGFRLVSGNLELWRADPYARELTSSVGEGVVHEPAFDWGDDGYRSPPWHELLIYELHIGTFHAAEDERRGTFDSAADRLPYLAELGVNAVLIMPPMEFAGDISWGYNPAHPFAVESAYGGPQALKRFVRAAHRCGIAVLLDVVYSHFGPSDLSLWQFDGWSQKNMGGIYFYQDWRAATPWGNTRPNYGRPEVRQYIRDNALMWLEDYHIDGLRFDATAYIRNVQGGEHAGDELPEGWNLLRWINAEVRSRQPWKITIADDLGDNQVITAPIEQGGAGFGAQWGAGFARPVRAALITPDDAGRDTAAVAAAIAGRYSDGAFRRVIYTEAHDKAASDRARLPHAIDAQDAADLFAQKRSTLGAGLVFTAPGIPLIFQGQEFLADGCFDDSRLLDWGRQRQFGGIVSLYRDLIALRRNRQGFTRGLSGQGCAVYHVDDTAKIIAYHRWHAGGPGDSVVVVANLCGQPRQDYRVGLPAQGRWRVRFNSDWQGYSPLFANTNTPDVWAIPQAQDGQPCSGAITIGPYSMVILSQG